MVATTDIPKRGYARIATIAAILAVAAIGAFALRDTLSFDTLRDNREALLAFRDKHFWTMAAAFVAIYVAIVAFSLPGATVASVTGGFLFGWVAGTLLNVLSATIGAAGPGTDVTGVPWAAASRTSL